MGGADDGGFVLFWCWLVGQYPGHLLAIVPFLFATGTTRTILPRVEPTFP
jgi:hypothetical protein